jgi:hypothetical protein
MLKHVLVLLVHLLQRCSHTVVAPQAFTQRRRGDASVWAAPPFMANTVLVPEEEHLVLWHGAVHDTLHHRGTGEICNLEGRWSVQSSVDGPLLVSPVPGVLPLWVRAKLKTTLWSKKDDEGSGATIPVIEELLLRAEHNSATRQANIQATAAIRFKRLQRSRARPVIEGTGHRDGVLGGCFVGVSCD